MLGHKAEEPRAATASPKPGEGSEPGAEQTKPLNAGGEQPPGISPVTEFLKTWDGKFKVDGKEHVIKNPDHLRQLLSTGTKGLEAIKENPQLKAQLQQQSAMFAPFKAYAEKNPEGWAKLQRVVGSVEGALDAFGAIVDKWVEKGIVNLTELENKELKGRAKELETQLENEGLEERRSAAAESVKAHRGEIDKKAGKPISDGLWKQLCSIAYARRKAGDTAYMPLDAYNELEPEIRAAIESTKPELEAKAVKTMNENFQKGQRMAGPSASPTPPREAAANQRMTGPEMLSVVERAFTRKQ